MFIIILIYNNFHIHTSHHCIFYKFVVSEEGGCCNSNNQNIMTSTPYAIFILQPITG